MSTVREACLQMLIDRGMGTIFGNPGSTELPMLAELPTEVSYVLALQEASAVGIADGFAQASGRPALVNLHTAPGLGNGMGAIAAAQANRSPLVILAGQQHRSLITLQANLTNRDATRMPHPLVKWSYEPPRAQDVPHALARAIHTASLSPRGPVMLSVPMDDWGQEIEREDHLVMQTTRSGLIRRHARHACTLAELARLLHGARSARHGRRPRHRRRRRLGGSGLARRAPAPERIRDPCAGRRQARLPREPPSLSRHPAAGGRTARAGASANTTSCWSPAHRSFPTTPTCLDRC